ncbi:hypothetical protein ACT0GK_004460 [Vibrio parahaemolyticus]
MIDSLKKVANFVLRQNFVIRNMIIVFFGSLGGATYLGKMSEVATYYYAWSSGFRVPAEGVPYLALTVFGMSFVVLISAFLVFIATYLFGRVMLSYTDNNVIFRLTASIFRLGIRNSNSIEVIAAGIGASSLVAVGAFVAPYVDSNIEISRWVLVPVSFVMSFVTFVVLWNKGALKVVAALIAAVCAIGAPISMFNQTTYTYALNSLQYGGGLSVDVTSNKVEYIDSKLLLRTSQALILEESKTNRVIEIPVSKVDKISYN